MSAETTAPLSPSRFLASKRYRWTALAALLVFFVFFLVRNHDSLPQRLPQGISSTYTYTGGDVDWSRFAYTQYVTNSDYLCNSVMFFESLHRLNSKADRVMMFPARMLKGEDDESSDARLLIKARDSYNVKLVPITIQHRDNADCTCVANLFLEQLLTTSSDLGRFLYQAPRFQPDSIQSCALDRFRLHASSTHGRTIPPTFSPSSHAPSLLAVARQGDPFISSRPHRALRRRVQAHPRQDRSRLGRRLRHGDCQLPLPRERPRSTPPSL